MQKEISIEVKKELQYRLQHPLHVTGIDDYVVIDIEAIKEWQKIKNLTKNKKK